MSGINFEKLKKEVWDRDNCSGCGACVAVCPADAIVFLDNDKSHPVNTGYCKDLNDNVPCGACYSVCPRTDSANIKGSMMGDFLEIKAAKSAYEVSGKQSGGAVTAILSNALDKGFIDAVVTVSEDKWNHKPKSVVITSKEAMIYSAGSRYNWWIPTLFALKEAVFKKKYANIAVIGTPCAVSALRLMKESDNDLLKPFGKSIRLIFGLFCTETFDYESLVEGKLKNEFGIEAWEIERLDVKGRLEVTLTDGTKNDISLKDLEGCIRKGCLSCTDLTAVDSDISAGAIGSPEGYTTIVVRTEEGKGFLTSAVNSGNLVLSDDVDLGPIERLAEKKAKRG
ncbi:4Fe-4S dicluster domain-containing protein [Methanoplanus sp. FWC-SCC4]|uniref:4Fe-4S dicluster domain-containing protein n=1 Tax=Methanochimaera problematica TaxID=2609417 RepID=A0AA97FDF9_9EURY|nr:Coenzyme F420 hydrogenase/dehydrogenase, beta subunit C-terminal domain [Methanoplanus sp. FWC-SCC4]WOF16218.1 4Fe-4S dicluster domain-containing protein [Methanoplanus sp. FWC-SCC4]